MKKAKIALVKQEIYQDLYVCPSEEKDASQILFSSQGRVGPIGLMAELGADFYIVKEEYDQETQIYKKVIPHISQHLYLLKTQTLDKLPGQGFKQPGSPHANGEFAQDAFQIDWGQYDIVISINISLPIRLIKKYPRTLFAYMIGEANLATRKAHFGYDITLNQMARGIITDKLYGAVDFPYTFLKGDTLEKLMTHTLKRSSIKQGVFMEINSTTERPVTKVPSHFQPLEEMGQKIILHKQKISDNLQSIFDAKYFVKMGGRTIRGNSVAEAISLGTLVIMNRNEIIHKELIIDECHVKTMNDTLALIKKLEENPDEYNRLLKKQQEAVTHYFYDCPLVSLLNCLKIKQHLNKPRPYTWINRLIDQLCFINFKLK